ncbi:WXG100 family type VII secretion target [Streptomyces sp. NPDC048527]|uniref:WXG100 family type VII secretion target n=1 Tax=Streptomyces sp. NPDC048527 TaxID=3365568 RepID=UPI0037243E55
MADGGFKAPPEMISAAASSCDTVAGDVDSQLAGLKSYVVGLEAWWQGIAQNTFQELMQEYDTYSQMLHNALTDIASGLRGNYVNYSDTEQQNINTITNIQQNLSTAKLT